MLLRRAHSNAIDMTEGSSRTQGEGCNKALTVGTTIMKKLVKLGTSAIVVKKGGIGIGTGSSHSSDDGPFTVHLPAHNGEFVIQVSGNAKFSTKSYCSNTRSLIDGATLELIEPGGNVKVWAGWSIGGVVTITSEFTFHINDWSQAPSASPTLAPTYLPGVPTPEPSPNPAVRISPTAAPSPAPSTAASTRSYSLNTVFTASVNDLKSLQTQAGNLAKVVAAKLGVTSSSVTVVSITTATTAASLVARRLGMDSFFHRALLDKVVITMSIGFATSAAASTATLSMQTYLASSQFITDLSTQTGGAVTISGVTITSLKVAIVDTNSYSYSCKLGSSLSLLWNYDNDHVYSAMLKKGSVGWLAGCVVPDSHSTMANSKVFLFAPSDPGRAGYYLMTDKTSSGFQRDTSQSVQSVQSTSTSSSLTFQGSSATSTRFIWAHGKDWPTVHAKGDYGFVYVYWADGVCKDDKGSVQAVSPAYVFLLLFLVVVYNSPLMRDLRWVKYLNALRVPSRVSIPQVGYAIGLEGFSVSGLIFMALFLVLVVLVLVIDPVGPTGLVTASTLPKRAGMVTIMCMWLTIIPTSKASLSYILFGVPLERMVKYHEAVVAIGMIFGLVHLIANLTFNAAVFFSPLPYGESGVRPLLGLVAFIIMAVMVLFSHRITRKFISYEIFMMLHQLYLVAVALMVAHVWLAGTLGAGFIPGILLHIIGKVERVKAMLTERKIVKAFMMGGIDNSNVSNEDLVVKHSFDADGGAEVEMTSQKLAASSTTPDFAVTCLTVPCVSSYEHGQYYFLHSSELADGPIDWHPISVSGITKSSPSQSESAPSDSSTLLMTFHIKSMGPATWSGRVAALVRRKALTKISVHGPFGNVSLSLRDYSSVTLLCGGIGITPLLPIIEDLVKNRAFSYPQLRIVKLIWSVREPEMVQLFMVRIRALLKDEEEGEREFAPTHCAPKDGKKWAAVADSSTTSPPPPLVTVVDIYKTVSKYKLLAVGMDVGGGLKNSEEQRSIAFHSSRVNIDSIVNEAATHMKAGLSCMVVCGPPAMAELAVASCATKGLRCHSEAFSM